MEDALGRNKEESICKFLKLVEKVGCLEISAVYGEDSYFVNLTGVERFQCDDDVTIQECVAGIVIDLLELSQKLEIGISVNETGRRNKKRHKVMVTHDTRCTFDK
jgi:hypothetical protein